MKKIKQFFKKKWVFYSLIEYIIAFFLTILLLFFQDRFTLLAWVNAMQVSGIILFAFGWLFFINNEGLFDVLTYGVQSFMKSIIGKRMNKSLYEYRVSKTPTPKVVYLSLWLHGLLLILISFVIYYI